MKSEGVRGLNGGIQIIPKGTIGFSLALKPISANSRGFWSIRFLPQSSKRTQPRVLTLGPGLNTDRPDIRPGRRVDVSWG